MITIDRHHGILILTFASRSDRTKRDFTDQEIVERTLYIMVNESPCSARRPPQAQGSTPKLSTTWKY
jgi:hypothetical protein